MAFGFGDVFDGLTTVVVADLERTARFLTLLSIGVMPAVLLERLLHPDAGLHVSQHCIVRLFQLWQQCCDLFQLFLGDDDDSFLSFVQHGIVSRSDNNAADLDGNINSPRLRLKRSPDRRESFAPDSELAIRAQLATARDVTHPAIYNSASNAADFEAGGDYISQESANLAWWLLEQCD